MIYEGYHVSHNGVKKTHKAKLKEIYAMNHQVKDFLPQKAAKDGRNPNLMLFLKLDDF